MIYIVVLVSGIQQNDSVIYMFIYTLFYHQGPVLYSGTLLSILYIVVCIFQSLPLFPLWEP